METWDPKPDAVPQFRGPFGAIRTTVPGVQFGELLPEQARIADKLAVVRERQPRVRRPHQGQPLDADRLRGPGVQRPRLHGAAAAVRWARRRRSSAAPNRPGMPPYAAVPHLRGGTDNFFHYAAYLGRGVQPVRHRVRPEQAGLPRPQPGPARATCRSTGWKTAARCSALDRPAQQSADAPGADPRRQHRAGVRSAHQPATWRRRSTSHAEPAAVRDRTAGTPSARAPCWPGGWSRPG